MNPSFDTRLLCKCSECGTECRATTHQISTRAGLIYCGNCGSVFNAAWNLVDEISNPIESSAPVAPISTTRESQDRTDSETIKNKDHVPGFQAGEHLFTLDDQLRQDLKLETEDTGALEEIRQTLRPADAANRLERKAASSDKHISHPQRINATYRNRLEPSIVESIPLSRDVPSSAGRRQSSRLSRVQKTRLQALWVLAVFIAVAGLFLQTRYWLFDELSAIPSARAPLESFCRLANCDVPAPLIGPVFRVLQTRVNLDPKMPGAIIVKVHIENRTTTSRPYPVIQLTLTDRDGRTISKRTYTQEDYGSAANTKELSPDITAVVTLHLAGPDENAVGFAASIVESGT